MVCTKSIWNRSVGIISSFRKWGVSSCGTLKKHKIISLGTNSETYSVLTSISHFTHSMDWKLHRNYVSRVLINSATEIQMKLSSFSPPNRCLAVKCIIASVTSAPISEGKSYKLQRRANYRELLMLPVLIYKQYIP